jgi:hypothetical protein
MGSAKQQTIDKILSFNYDELAEWISARLHGYDKYFPVYLGHEPNLSGFLIDAFHHIKDKKFRCDFIEILGDLTKQLKGFNKTQVKDSREYISELLVLCGNIKQFENKDFLLEMAVSGKFKGIIMDEETDLHAGLLSTLASYRISGILDFWLAQLYDDSNKYYANPAFYALMDNLGRLFEHIGVFIDRFKGEVELVLGLGELIDEYGSKEVIDRFKQIESKLSLKQKEAVNSALIELDYNEIFMLEAAPEMKLKYEALPRRLQYKYIGMPTPEYKTMPGVNLEERTAEIFKLMGFDVEVNKKIAGHFIDIFLKKKKSIGNRYECWICLCSSRGDKAKKRVGKAAVDRLYSMWESVEEELEKQPGICCDDCQAIIVSEIGFTRGAIESAGVLGIELKTLEQLFSGLVEFHSSRRQLTQDFETWLSQRSKL